MELSVGLLDQTHPDLRGVARPRVYRLPRLHSGSQSQILYKTAHIRQSKPDSGLGFQAKVSLFLSLAICLSLSVSPWRPSAPGSPRDRATARTRLPSLPHGFGVLRRSLKFSPSEIHIFKTVSQAPCLVCGAGVEGAVLHGSENRCASQKGELQRAARLPPSLPIVHGTCKVVYDT